MSRRTLVSSTAPTSCKFGVVVVSLAIVIGFQCGRGGVLHRLVTASLILRSHLPRSCTQLTFAKHFFDELLLRSCEYLRLCQVCPTDGSECHAGNPAEIRERYIGSPA